VEHAGIRISPRALTPTQGSPRGARSNCVIHAFCDEVRFSSTMKIFSAASERKKRAAQRNLVTCSVHIQILRGVGQAKSRGLLAGT